MRQNRRFLWRIATLAGAPFAFGLALSLVLPLKADDEEDVSQLLIPDGPVPVASSEWAHATGEVQIVVRLVDAPLSVANGPDAKQRGGKLSRAQQRSYLRNLDQKQSALMGQIRGLGGRELGHVSKAHNAVAVTMNASQIGCRRRAAGGVRAVTPHRQLRARARRGVPAIGAGRGAAPRVRRHRRDLGVLDPGIDYTHAELGGRRRGRRVRRRRPQDHDPPMGTALFRTAKVVGGYDFVRRGLAPTTLDAPWLRTPIRICGGGRRRPRHPRRRHRAAAGAENRPSRPGPWRQPARREGVQRRVVVVQRGLALLQGMDFVLDPNGDDAIDDAVDVINMSIGSSYGQREDDLTEASANAVRYGVVVVASAGNSADRPYITGSPASTPEVISVAQTQVPSALSYPLVINAPENIDGVYPNTATLEWAPIGDGFTGDVVFVGRGCPAGTVAPGAPADPYLADPAGKVALIDRGACNISAKVRRASDAGAIGVLIGLIAAGDASSFSNGGDCRFRPTAPASPSLVIIKD